MGHLLLLDRGRMAWAPWVALDLFSLGFTSIGGAALR